MKRIKLIVGGKEIVTPEPKEYKKENFAIELIGMSVMIYLKNGESFRLKVTAGGPTHISGHDQEGMNQVVNFTDIDCVVG